MNVEEIKQALAAAEVGPWAKVIFCNGTSEVWQSIDNSGICRIIGNNEVDEANTHLIANAPTWLAQLLEERAVMVEALKKSHTFIESIMGFYGEGLQVHNWHQNGDAEPWDNLFDNNMDGDELELIENALRKVGELP